MLISHAVSFLLRSTRRKAFRLDLCLLAVTSLAMVSPASAAESAPATKRVYLSGHGFDDAVSWDFKLSEGRGSGAWTKIAVPSCWELQGFGTYQYGIGYYGVAKPPGIAREQGVYRHKFTVPKEWENRRVRIVFEGVMTDASVRINGASAGPKHQGAFYRFRYDITDRLKFGAENELEVTVDKESENDSVNLAERRADYWNFGGIFRPVFLEVVPPRFIERAAIAADADGSFRADVFLGQAVPDGAEISAVILDAAGKPQGEAFKERVARGGDQVTLKTKLSSPALWTAETPSLYQVRFTLVENGAAKHQLEEKFGFRTFEIRANEGLFLNGQRVLMKGVNRHSFWPDSGRTLSTKLNYDDVKLMKELNLNAVRMSHYPPDPEFLDACDELGLYVLDELGGWHGKYDEAVGNKLVAEMVTRDVNHPSILFWDNGNEGGWNTELDDEFAKWDPRARPVIHPSEKMSGIDSMHYRTYGLTQEYLRQPYIFMPTEMLHGLYDGGHGAAMWDYWEVMRKHPRSGGGFLWDWADEGVVRTDQEGRIDTQGNYGADGIVGPHHEKEGSFFTVKQVWSPVQVMDEKLPADFDGTLTVENRYDFTPLERCSFSWQLAKFPGALETAATGHQVVAGGDLRGPAIPAHGAGKIKLPLPADWKKADVLYVTAKSPDGSALWTWSWRWNPVAPVPAAPSGSAVTTAESGNETVVQSGDLELRFDRSNGRLAGVALAGKTISLGNGPRFIGMRRADRNADGAVLDQKRDGRDRFYKEFDLPEKLESFTVTRDGDAAVVKATYFGALEQTTWRIAPGGDVRLDYDYRYDGIVEMLGVHFDYPEQAMRSVRWLGAGPYRVWQNRLQGTTLDVWTKNYNDPIPGESFDYPEFKGYHRDWQWAEFETSEARVIFGNRGSAEGSYFGIYTPRDGRDAFLYTLPPSGLAILDVIPAVRSKVGATDVLGPSSQAPRVSGPRHGSLWFRFLPLKK